MSSVNIENLLYEEVGARFGDLHTKNLGTEERKAAFNELDRLLDKVIEHERIEVESEDKAAARESEKNARESEELLKMQQLESEKREQWIKIGIEVTKFVLGAVVTVAMVNKTLKFEETGSVTTMAGRFFLPKGFSLFK